MPALSCENHGSGASQLTSTPGERRPSEPSRRVMMKGWSW
jgi:hypothetical protein